MYILGLAPLSVPTLSTALAELIYSLCILPGGGIEQELDVILAMPKGL